MNIPSWTAEVFDLLSKGQFLCSDSIDRDNRKLYSLVDDSFEDMHQYFSAIGFVLERGEEYFYFSRKESRVDLERKIEQAYRWIDIVDFCKAFNSAFGAGLHFSSSEIEVQLRMDVNLKDKLEGLRRITGDGSYSERIKKIINELVGAGYAELENDITMHYKVVAGFKYIEQLIVSISISEELHHEVSQ